MIDIHQLRTAVIRPVINRMGMGGAAAERLLVGTALAESLIGGTTYLRQRGGGPARGIYQIEPATARDVLFRYLAARPDLYDRAERGLLRMLPGPLITDEALAFLLTTDLALGTAVARLKYWMDPAMLPGADDLTGLGALWKRVYNTAAGAGDADEFARLLAEHL